MLYSNVMSVKEATSKVLYECIDGCLLNNDILCDKRFLKMHKVSVKLSPS